MINSVVLAGNLTREPEIRSTKSGMPVMTFGIAVNDRQKVGDEWKDYANFFDVTMFGTRAESLSKYLCKGKKVAVSGKLHWSKYKDKDGFDRSKVEIIANDVEFMSQGEKQQEPQQESMYESFDMPF